MNGQHELSLDFQKLGMLLTQILPGNILVLRGEHVGDGTFLSKVGGRGFALLPDFLNQVKGLG